MALPPATLLGAMAVLAVVENIFPPIPADLVIAFGAFIAARSHRSPLPVFVIVLIGNVAGAIAMYAAGRRFGADWTERKFHIRHEASGDARLTAWYARYGVGALFLGRFIPGVRAVVAPFAGALRASFPLTAAAITLASALWYGVITFIAFRTGSSWDMLAGTIGRLARNTGLVAATIVCIIVVMVVVRRRRKR